MAKILTRKGLIDYAKRKLGFSVVTIEIAEEQYDDLVDDALQVFSEFHGEGTERLFLKHTITSEDLTNKYLPMPDHVTSVLRIMSIPALGIGGAGIFDIRYQMRLNDLYTFTGTSLVYFTTAMRHLDLLDWMFNQEKIIRFNRNRGQLQADLDWDNTKEGDILVIECYSALDPEEFVKIYNNQWVKEYFTAICKKQWGTNLKKQKNIKLLDGIEFSGQEIYNEAVEEIKQLNLDLNDKWSLPVDFMMG